MLQKKTDILKLSLFFFFWVFLLSFCIHKVYNYDIWWHLKTGEYIVQNLTVPEKDIYTYSVSNHDWIDLHWLFQVFVYVVHLFSGYNGLILTVAAVIALLFSILFRLIPPGVSKIVTFAVLLPSVFIIERRFFIRPEIFTYVYMALMLLVLSKKEQISFKRVIFTLFLIQLFWVNMQGLFVLGLLITGCFLVEKIIRLLFF